MGLAAGGALAALSLSSAYSQAQALKQQGAYQQQVYDQNASFADMQGKDAIARGDRSAANVGTQTKRLIGSQRAASAAQGVDVNSGSAAELQVDSAGLGALDQLTTKNNAWREAWGYKVESLNSTSKGIFASMGANNDARSTMLTGGMQALGQLATGAKDSGYGVAKPTQTRVSGGGY